MRKLVVISNDVVDVEMAGPGMRYLEIARALAKDLDVTLAVPGTSSQSERGELRVCGYDLASSRSIRDLITEADVILLSPITLFRFPWIARENVRLIVDLYDPFIYENLFYYLEESLETQIAYHNRSLQALRLAATAGDYFICGHERQRDMWLGVLTALGRINPLTFSDDPALRHLIDVVGVGIPSREVASRRYLKGIHPAVPKNARVVLWGGGVWNWLDPITLINAWPEVLEAYPEARLVFIGLKHPNPDVPRHAVAQELKAVADEKGLTNHSVIFLDWLNYHEREYLLAEADVGVVLHLNHIESHFSIRTRVMDYIWAKLPVVVTQGDVTSQWIEKFKLGHVVPYNDQRAVAKAIIAVLDQPKSSWGNTFEAVQPFFRWEIMVEPVRKYCLDGGKAPDSQFITQFISTGGGYWSRIKFLYKTEGSKGLYRRIWRRIRSYLTIL